MCVHVVDMICMCRNEIYRCFILFYPLWWYVFLAVGVFIRCAAMTFMRCKFRWHTQKQMTSSNFALNCVTVLYVYVVILSLSLSRYICFCVNIFIWFTVGKCEAMKMKSETESTKNHSFKRKKKFQANDMANQTPITFPIWRFMSYIAIALHQEFYSIYRLSSIYIIKIYKPN